MHQSVDQHIHHSQQNEQQISSFGIGASLANVDPMLRIGQLGRWDVNGICN